MAQKLLPKEDIPEEIEAASYALTLLKVAGVNTWDELETTPLQPKRRAALKDIVLDEDQRRILEEYRQIVRLVCVGPPMVTISVCETCGNVMAVCGSSSTKCRRPKGCAGKTMRASAAARVRIEE